jgi:hypothetical protein
MVNEAAEHPSPSATRRRVLRGATGIAAAGMGAALPAAASAAPGDALVLGEVNDAGTAGTTIQSKPIDYPSTNEPFGPALTLSNSAGVPLKLEPTPFTAFPGVDDGNTGEMFTDPDGDFYAVQMWPYRDENNNLVTYRYPATQYTTRWSTCTVPIKPVRAFDTRNAGQRANIVAGANSIGSDGVVAGGATIVISLDSYVDLGYALHGNITVTKTGGGGYITVWGTGGRPLSSTVNFWASGLTLANAVLTPLGPFGGHSSCIAVFCSISTAVFMDIVAFDVPGPWQVLAPLSGGTLSADTLAQMRARRGAWRQPVQPLTI